MRREGKAYQLLEQFAAEDCLPQIKQMLLAELERLRRGVEPKRVEFTFNRFNVVLDAEQMQALIEGDLNPGSEGEYVMSLDEYRSTLDNMPSP